MGKDIELAILFADVVGSTRLYDTMGDLRARDMVAICIDVMRTATEQRQGTVIKTMGDEVMATFPSADAALNAAAFKAASALGKVAMTSSPMVLMTVPWRCSVAVRITSMQIATISRARRSPMVSYSRVDPTTSANRMASSMSLPM